MEKRVYNKVTNNKPKEYPTSTQSEFITVWSVVPVDQMLIKLH